MTVGSGRAVACLAHLDAPVERTPDVEQHGVLAGRPTGRNGHEDLLGRHVGRRCGCEAWVWDAGVGVASSVGTARRHALRLRGVTFRSAPMTAGDGIRDWTTPGRPPLVPEITLLLAEDIHRTWSAIDEEAPPFWAFAWVGGQALARHVLDHPDLVRGPPGARPRRGLGAGRDRRGRARAPPRSSPRTPTPGPAPRSRSTRQANGRRGRRGRRTCWTRDELELDVDVVLAGDVFYEQPMARHVERFCDEAVAAGVDVLVGDPGREYLPRRRCTALGDLRGRSAPPTSRAGRRRAPRSTGSPEHSPPRSCRTVTV